MSKQHEHHKKMVADFRRRFIVSSILTVPILILSPTIQQWLGIQFLTFAGSLYVVLLLSTVVYFYGGYPFLSGMKDELESKNPGMMTLIAVAITVAYVYSSAVVLGLEGSVFFWELATLVDIMLAGHWIEMRSVMGASKALEELVKLIPATAHVVQSDGSIEDIPVDELETEQEVVVKPGEKIPSDGEITEGKSSINEAMITGESTPVEKGVGDEVIGGSINGESTIRVEIKKVGEDTYLSQVVEIVREAQESKSKTQDLANRAAFILTIIALVSGSITLSTWYALGFDLQFGIERAVTVMVITCPHALGLAIPLVVAMSTSISAQNGLIVRNRAAFERARDLDAVIFDKTGTLTEGKFSVTDVFATSDTPSEELLRLAASVENLSEHPIALGVVRGARERDITLREAHDFSAIPGKGAVGYVNDLDVRVVSPGYLREEGIDTDFDAAEQFDMRGKTIVYVLLNGEPKGALALADVIRDESRDAIARLKDMGIKCMMLTGDNKSVAQWVAEELDLDDYFAEVLPDEKAAKVEEVQARGNLTAMVGDGVNDAPALATADLGIAIGAGTDVAIETADIVLVRNSPLDASVILTLSQKTYDKMLQNLVWATGYNAFAIPLAAGVLYWANILLSPAVGAILMSLSTVIVAINARLLSLERERAST
jgi:Cu2+-exporting ATPase